MEPARRIELRLSPYHGNVLPLSLSRQSWGQQDSELHHPDPKVKRVPVTPFSIESPCPVPIRTVILTRDDRSPDPKGIVSRAGFEPALPATSGSCTLGGSRTRINLALNQARLPDCGTSAWSLRAESNRLPVPYEGTALPGELRRRGCPPWIRTTIDEFRVRRPAD